MQTPEPAMETDTQPVQTVSAPSAPRTALQLTTHVLPGNRIEISSPQLEEGQPVDVIVLLPQARHSEQPSALDIIRSLPPGPHSYPTWEEFERAFQEERNSWDR